MQYVPPEHRPAPLNSNSSASGVVHNAVSESRTKSASKTKSVPTPTLTPTPTDIYSNNPKHSAQAQSTAVATKAHSTGLTRHSPSVQNFNLHHAPHGQSSGNPTTKLYFNTSLFSPSAASFKALNGNGVLGVNSMKTPTNSSTKRTQTVSQPSSSQLSRQNHTVESPSSYWVDVPSPVTPSSSSVVHALTSKGKSASGTTDIGASQGGTGAGVVGRRVVGLSFSDVLLGRAPSVSTSTTSSSNTFSSSEPNIIALPATEPSTFPTNGTDAAPRSEVGVDHSSSSSVSSSSVNSLFDFSTELSQSKDNISLSHSDGACANRSRMLATVPTVPNVPTSAASTPSESTAESPVQIFLSGMTDSPLCAAPYVTPPDTSFVSQEIAQDTEAAQENLYQGLSGANIDVPSTAIVFHKTGETSLNPIESNPSTLNLNLAVPDATTNQDPKASTALVNTTSRPKVSYANIVASGAVVVSATKGIVAKNALQTVQNNLLSPTGTVSLDEVNVNFHFRLFF